MHSIVLKKLSIYIYIYIWYTFTFFFYHYFQMCLETLHFQSEILKHFSNTTTLL